MSSGDLQDRPPLQMRTITYIDEAASRKGVIMSWKSDCSPQGMTVIVISLEPMKNKN
jgi:hypothetical protein